MKNMFWHFFTVFCVVFTNEAFLQKPLFDQASARHLRTTFINGSSQSDDSEFRLIITHNPGHHLVSQLAEYPGSSEASSSSSKSRTSCLQAQRLLSVLRKALPASPATQSVDGWMREIMRNFHLALEEQPLGRMYDNRSHRSLAQSALDEDEDKDPEVEGNGGGKNKVKTARRVKESWLSERSETAATK
ncbi:hypothetical protein DFJ77DRAFT_480790 [Powellomyces hirtus]|nr:hypothetical protein DFJ77DRAFT_480790 [Powellomyces hirtus]